MLIVQLLFQIGPGEVPKAYSSLSGNEKEVLSLSLYMYVSSEGGNFTPPHIFLRVGFLFKRLCLNGPQTLMSIGP